MANDLRPTIETNADRQSRSDKAWEMAKQYAKEKAELMYPDVDRRRDAERRLAHEEYLRLMYP